MIALIGRLHQMKIAKEEYLLMKAIILTNAGQCLECILFIVILNLTFVLHIYQIFPWRTTSAWQNCAKRWCTPCRRR